MIFQSTRLGQFSIDSIDSIDQLWGLVDLQYVVGNKLTILAGMLGKMGSPVGTGLQCKKAGRTLNNIITASGR